MTTDAELLHRFARTNAEDAFAELVQRHVSLVHAAALRQVGGDAHLARDVAQTVFTDLARKAGSLANHASITGWLYTSAHFAAAKIIRTETRRRDREEKFMREPINESAPAAEWENLRPLLDAAMHGLKVADREAILLRYFENRPFAEVGTRLGLNENAARMKVDRALEKLRAEFLRRGVTATSALAAVISANAVPLAPTGLAATLTTTALASAGAGTFTLLKIMTMTKIKLALTALVAASAATALVVQHQTQTKLRAENELLQQQLTQKTSVSESISNPPEAASNVKPLTNEQYLELMKLRGEVGVLRGQVNEFKKSEQARARAETDAKQLMASVKSDVALARAKAQFKMDEIKAINDIKQVSLACRIFAADHNNEFPTNFDQITLELGSMPTNSLGNFEFMNAGTINEKYPQMIAFRERVSRQALDGSMWNRIYALADGSVHVAKSADGNFDAWEKQNTTALPANQ